MTANGKALAVGPLERRAKRRPAANAMLPAVSEMAFPNLETTIY